MLAFGRKAMTNLDSIFKNRYIISPTWVSIVKTMVFPVVMHRCQKWIINKAEHWRIDAFELWCWQTLDSPLDSKEIKPVNLKRNQPWVFISISSSNEYSGLISFKIDWFEPSWTSNNLTIWCEELPHWKRFWCWERLRGREEGADLRGNGWMASPTQWTWVWANYRRYWKTGKPGVL